MQQAFWILKIAALVILGFVLLTLLLRIFNTTFGGKSRRIAKWAKKQAFSPNQLSTMRLIWQWMKNGQAPDHDPIKVMSNNELAELINKCDLSFKPPELRYRHEAEDRLKFMREMQNKGMNEIQAQIATAMKFCYFGPANDL